MLFRSFIAMTPDEIASLGPPRADLSQAVREILAKDGIVKTPVPNGTFLNGITRQRVIGLLRQGGVTVEEVSLRYSDFEQADEIFSSGNYSKVVPVGRIDDRQLQPGPLYRKARELYMDFANSKSV